MPLSDMTVDTPAGAGAGLYRSIGAHSALSPGHLYPQGCCEGCCLQPARSLPPAYAALERLSNAVLNP